MCAWCDVGLNILCVNKATSKAQAAFQGLGIENAELGGAVGFKQVNGGKRDIDADIGMRDGKKMKNKRRRGRGRTIRDGFREHFSVGAQFLLKQLSTAIPNDLSYGRKMVEIFQSGVHFAKPYSASHHNSAPKRRKRGHGLNGPVAIATATLEQTVNDAIPPEPRSCCTK